MKTATEEITKDLADRAEAAGMSIDRSFDGANWYYTRADDGTYWVPSLGWRSLDQIREEVSDREYDRSLN